ncbi:TadE family protein [Petroclostridium sp. X23]|uniref:TadE/TadG family type IV pilus assembly protein n=1 Tax=Petroclostridium sp. X23 TaxID=3045146 RepID=UPI0024AD0BDD|nr:TadE family protein [Petroclostridium sp. X23]WHH57946.1 pilus assembly protein [Petroclostridium sp. X23]
MLKLIGLNKQNDSGQALVEFALTLWMYILITFFIIDFGWVSYQRISFEYGYMHSSWSVSAADLGDTDALEEVPSTAVYAGAVVSDVLFDVLSRSSLGIIGGNVTIADANAVLYNQADSYNVPGRTPGNPVQAISRTRYMDLTADFSYVIQPLTPIGSLFLGNDITVEKELTCTRVVRTQHRSE